MSSGEQAQAYLEEARLTLASARAIFEAANSGRTDMWAQVVKNGYDAIEQAVSAAIAAAGGRIPRQHPAKITEFIDLYGPEDEFSERVLYGSGAGTTHSMSTYVVRTSTSRTSSSTGETLSESSMMRRPSSSTSRSCCGPKPVDGPVPARGR